MDIRKATEQDIDAILALNRQIGQLHFEQVPEVFCPPSPEDRAFLLGAIADEARVLLVGVVAGVVGGVVTA
ncbi:GNAT family N-acetyltransferase, partial [Aeromonas caviae]